jgi:glycine oxidase
VSKPATPDIVVVGGGTIGLGIAWRAAQRGFSVAVADDAPGRGASWAAAGMLAPITEIHFGEETLLALTRESSRRYPDFIGELEDVTGLSTGYTQAGTLMVAACADDFSRLSDLYRYQVGLGLTVQRLTRRELRSLEPGFSGHVRGGYLIEGDHAVDNRLLTAALIEACRRAGVEFVPKRVERIETERGAVTGVSLMSDSFIPAGTVVLAAGCWSGAIPGLPDHAIPPVRPVKGQLLYLGSTSSPAFVARNVRGADVYIVPRRDGRIVVGATVEERGFDVTVTAGAVYELLRNACELLPDLREYALLEVVAGLRPGSPDNAPLLGPGALKGLVIATGHYRNGILLTPVTADEIARFLDTGRVGEVVAPFSPARFAREAV